MTKRLQKDIAQLPQKPGVYLFKDKHQLILYIGKAKQIRMRVQSHFKRGSNFANFYPQVRSIEYIQTKTEKDALILENQLIKKYQPKYNVELKDDKNYSFVAFTRDIFPRLFVTHQPRSADVEYIGPFVRGKELKHFLFEIRNLFPYRTCPSRRKSSTASKNKPEKPCLYYDLGLCWAHGSKQKKYNLVDVGIRALLRLYNGEPIRIECYDVSHTQGSLSVGSMVSFKGQRADKSMYRKFKIKTVQGPNDPKSLLEIITRRLRHTEWSHPDIIVVDGGKSQLSKLKNIPVPILALAKLNREKRAATVFSPYGKSGVSLSVFPDSISNTLLALRDESHRFAITYHRFRRAKNLLS